MATDDWRGAWSGAVSASGTYVAVVRASLHGGYLLAAAASKWWTAVD